MQCLFEVMILCGIGDNILWYQRSCFVVLVMIFCGVDDDIDPGCRDARVLDFWGSVELSLQRKLTTSASRALLDKLG